MSGRTVRAHHILGFELAPPLQRPARRGFPTRPSRASSMGGLVKIARMKRAATVLLLRTLVRTGFMP